MHERECERVCVCVFVLYPSAVLYVLFIVYRSVDTKDE